MDPRRAGKGPHTDKHVFGFRVFADGAVNGLVTVASSGISRDTHDPLPDGSFNLDFTGTVAGPIGPTSVVPEPSNLISACLGLAGLAGYAGWGRLRGWPRLLTNRGRGATRGREEPPRLSNPRSNVWLRGRVKARGRSGVGAPIGFVGSSGGALGCLRLLGREVVSLCTMPKSSDRMLGCQPRVCENLR